MSGVGMIGGHHDLVRRILSVECGRVIEKGPQEH